VTLLQTCNATCADKDHSLNQSIVSGNFFTHLSQASSTTISTTMSSCLPSQSRCNNTVKLKVPMLYQQTAAEAGSFSSQPSNFCDFFLQVVFNSTPYLVKRCTLSDNRRPCFGFADPCLVARFRPHKPVDQKLGATSPFDLADPENTVISMFPWEIWYLIM
jgi:hypothetical protein